jgi:hypothetical protein
MIKKFGAYIDDGSDESMLFPQECWGNAPRSQAVQTETTVRYGCLARDFPATGTGQGLGTNSDGTLWQKVWNGMVL